MKKHLLQLINTIYWFFKRLTPNGRKDYIIAKAFSGIQQSKRNGNITKLKVIDTANKLLKPKKIITFHKGKSITKPKKSNHQVIKQASEKHSEDLKQQNLKVTKKGKFKHA
ncbi:hypothetical protein [Winogradskyella pulchriflava]|uniref:Uncharacterized protein n=1 Tax=Winogradskyella pulchriflava TaxID=1110688 RepID=A0ABV6QES2_9FLAO